MEGTVERGTTKVFSVSGEVEHGISSEGTERTMSMMHHMGNLLHELVVRHLAYFQQM